MKPGRELDALVAEKVMGAVDHGYALMQGTTVLRIREVSGSHYTASLHHYSTDIAAAWEVLEKVEADDFWCKLTRKTYSRHPAHETDPMWECYLRCVRGGTRKGPVAAAETAPHAICLAALRAVGVEVDDG